MRIYSLQHWKLDAIPERGLMHCYLYGIGYGWRGKLIAHQESVYIPLCKYEPVQETVRRAVAASSHVWKVSLLKNLSAFDGKFYQPVREQAHEAENPSHELDEGTIKVAQRASADSSTW